MTTAKDPRAVVAKAKRIVVKIGSRTLASDRGVYTRLAEAVKLAHTKGRHVVIVSSGAIALGTAKLGFPSRPKEMAKLQAAAAAGQSLLMQAYEEAFATVDVPVAQVLLTHADLAHRTRANNARAALAALLDAGAVPILNENDSVSVEEIKFGDNDQLASMVTPLIDAELLVLLSDVDGLLDSDGARIPIVRDVAKDALPHIRASKSSVGTGGMASKVEAARRATLAGASVVVADARMAGVVGAVLDGADVGTLFVPSEKRLTARKYWIAFTLRPRGDVVLDRGAALAVRGHGKSILAVGVLGIRGLFGAGDCVRILDADGTDIGRGLAGMAAVDALSILGKRKGDGAGDGSSAHPHAAKEKRDELIHRDELVIWD